MPGTLHNARRLILAITALVILGGPFLHKTATKREIYPAVLLPVGAFLVDHANARIPVVRRHVVAKREASDIGITIRNFASFLPPGMPEKYVWYILEDAYEDQGLAVTDSAAAKRLRSRRSLLAQWLSAKGLPGIKELVLVEQRMTMSFRNGQTQDPAPPTHRVLKLSPKASTDFSHE